MTLSQTVHIMEAAHAVSLSGLFGDPRGDRACLIPELVLLTAPVPASAPFWNDLSLRAFSAWPRPPVRFLGKT
jgi:hypothetical protein